MSSFPTPRAGGPDSAGLPIRLVELPGDDVAARQRLPLRASAYWRVKALVQGVLVVALITWGAVGLDWPHAGVRWSLVGLALSWFLLVGVVVRPPIRRRLFWYALSDNEIDLQHGWLVQTRTLVPMNRVQHLKTEQGLLARRFRLADLHIHTAAGTVVVHALDQDEAAAVRSRIGLLAHLADDL